MLPSFLGDHILEHSQLGLAVANVLMAVPIPTTTLKLTTTPCPTTTLKITTTPCPTTTLAVTTTPCPTTTPKPENPCTTIAPKAALLYSAEKASVIQKVAQKDENSTQSWVMPVLGMLSMLALAAGVGLSVFKRRGVRRSTREVRAYQDIEEAADTQTLLE